MIHNPELKQVNSRTDEGALEAFLWLIDFKLRKADTAPETIDFIIKALSEHFKIKKNAVKQNENRDVLIACDVRKSALLYGSQDKDELDKNELEKIAIKWFTITDTGPENLYLRANRLEAAVANVRKIYKKYAEISKKCIESQKKYAEFKACYLADVFDIGFYWQHFVSAMGQDINYIDMQFYCSNSFHESGQ